MKTATGPESFGMFRALFFFNTSRKEFHLLFFFVGFELQSC